MGALLLGLLFLLSCASPPEGRGFLVHHEVQEAALLSVWADEDWVYAVGADPGDGPRVLRYDGAAWQTLETGARGTLWWIAADGPDSLLLVGEGGLVLSHVQGSNLFVRQSVPTTSVLYGAWVAPDGTAYAVGGDFQRDTGRGVILARHDGTWSEASSVPEGELDAHVLFKVWGQPDGHLWVAGEGGTVLRSVGGGFERVETGITGRLLTVHGSEGAGPFVVGGAGNGVILEWTSDAFVDRSPDFMPAVNGVYVRRRGRTLAVGMGGLIARARAGGAFMIDDAAPTSADLHAVFVGPNGVAWAVGGNLLSPVLDGGVIVRSSR